MRTDKLLVSCYALHGDMCSNAPHCESLGCASRLKSTDYVLVARFAYLQEAIDYCQDGAKRGVHMRLVSRICKPQYVSNYSPQAKTERELGYPLQEQIAHADKQVTHESELSGSEFVGRMYR